MGDFLFPFQFPRVKKDKSKNPRYFFQNEVQVAKVGTQHNFGFFSGIG